MLEVRSSDWIQRFGVLTSVSGQLCARLDASLKELVKIHTASGNEILCEVIGFDRDLVHLMPFTSNTEFRAGDKVTATGSRMSVGVGLGLLGRVLNAMGEPIDGGPPVIPQERIELAVETPGPLSRPTIDTPFCTGIRAIDGMLTIGRGQRMGLFAGSGVGKSTLLGEITKYAESQINVVVMVGERGREVRPFIEQSLGPEGLQKSIVFVSTSDQPPLARIRVCELAIAVANWFRSLGNDVLFMLDSLTRMAYAQRELGLFLGEPPTSRGYTPSVFQKMAELLEQLGTSEKGSITGLLTVLVDGDDMNDPVADSARSILDGHIVLSRDLANSGHFPAIDILQSASRLFHEIGHPDHQQNAMKIRAVMSKYKEVEDLIQIGAYKQGASPATDRAVGIFPHVQQLLRQGLNDPCNYKQTQTDFAELARQIEVAA